MPLDEAESLDALRLPAYLSDPVGVVRRRWPWMLLALFAGIVATTLYVALLNPRYVASATIVIASQQIPEDFVRPTIPADSLERIDATIGEIRSRATLIELIETHNLYPNFRASETPSELAARMRDDIYISQDKGIGLPKRRYDSNMLTISFEAHSPDAAADVSNDLARRFIDASIRSRSDQARTTTEFLRRELVRADEALREQSGKIAAFKERYRGELPGDLAANLGKLDRLEQRRQSLSLQIARAESSQARLWADEYADPEARLVALRGRLNAELVAHTERHPDIVALRREIEALEGEIQSAPPAGIEALSADSSIPAASHRTMRELRAQLTATEHAIRERDARVDRTPGRQAELDPLEERASVLRETYLEFLRKVEDAELAQELERSQQGERFSIVDVAVPPLNPIRSHSRYLAGGLAVSLFLSLAVGVLLETFDPLVLNSEQLEAAVQLPVLGSVPRIV